MGKTLRLAEGALAGVEVDERVVAADAADAAADAAAVAAADAETGDGVTDDVATGTGTGTGTATGETELAREAAAEDGGVVLRILADVLRDVADGLPPEPDAELDADEPPPLRPFFPRPNLGFDDLTGGGAEDDTAGDGVELPELGLLLAGVSVRVAVAPPPFPPSSFAGGASVGPAAQRAKIIRAAVLCCPEEDAV